MYIYIKNVRYFIFNTVEMAEIIKYIEKINTLNYSGQCKYAKTKLLSFKTIDVPHTVFFKKLYVLLDNLPWYIKESNIKVGVRKELIINFWWRFEEGKYFHDDRGYIQIECIKLPDSIYLVIIPIKNTDRYIYIHTKDKYNNNNECKKI